MSGHNKGWIGVDLDGTLAHYDGWHGIEHIGQPIAPMVDRIREWLEEGTEVRIFTARVSDPHTAYECRSAIQEWLITICNLPPLEVTNVKDFAMIQLWDDRAIQIIANTGTRADGKP